MATESVDSSRSAAGCTSGSPTANSESKATGSPTANSESKTTIDGSKGVTENLKCGWLGKRTKLSHTWERRWFLLESNMLQYGNDAQSLNKNIPLDGTEIAEAEIDRKQFVFRLKPSESRRTYYLHAANPEDLQEWMQAICFAKAASRHGDASQACCLQ